MFTTLAILTAAPMKSVNDTIIAIDRHTKGYSIYTPVDGGIGKYAIWELTTQGVPGMNGMKEAEVRSFSGYDDRDAVVGGAWYPYALNGMYGDRARWSKSPGAYMEFTVQTEPGQVIGLVNFKTTNGGIGAVTVDGQSSLANLLPEMNGMRYVDFFSAQGPTPNLFKNNRTPIPIADSLPAGTHTVRVHFTGLRSPGSSDSRVYVDGVGVYNRQATEDETVRGDFFVLGVSPLTTNGAWESVFKVGAKFYGTNQHGNELVLAGQTQADGSAVELGVYQTATAEHFSFLSQSQVSVDTAGTVATNTRAHNFSSEGLSLQQRTQWHRALPMTHIYSAMWPILDGSTISADAEFEPFEVAPDRKHRFDLTYNDLFFKGGFDARNVTLFNRQNARTFRFEVEDLDQNLTNPRFWVWDLGAPAYNKLYFQRQTERHHVKQGETWTSTTKYRYYYDPLRMSEL